MTDDLSLRALLDSVPNHRTTRPAKALTPAVLKERRAEAARRSALAYKRADRALRILYSADFVELRRQAAAEVAAERGPLPGDDQ